MKPSSVHATSQTPPPVSPRSPIRFEFSGLACLVAAVLSGCSGSHDERPQQPPTVENREIIAESPPPEAKTEAETEAETEVPETTYVAMREAASQGKTGIVRQALEAGANVNQNDENGRTALMLGAFNGHTEVVRFLLKHGASVDPRDIAGRTALMFAASGPYPETVDWLLQGGAKVDVQDSGEGWTALMFAAGEGHFDVVRLLLDRGADPTITDVDGDQAKDFAERGKHDQVARMLETASSKR